MNKWIVFLLVLALILTALPVSAQGGPTSYQVEAGDAWSGIARSMGVRVCRLVLANGHVRCTAGLARRLLPGQTLRVPR